MTRHPGPRRVVLTGGIGSGKSAVGRLFRGWGAVVVDADALARDVVALGTPGLAAVVEAFGESVLTDGGELDRAALAAVVFEDPARLAQLEAIVHPLVRRAADEQFAEAPHGALLVYEVPLPGERQPGDWVLVVDAPEDVRRARLLARGLEEEQIGLRMARQPGRQEWLGLADRVVDNGGDLDDLEQQVRQVWREITGEEPPTGAGDPAVGGGD